MTPSGPPEVLVDASVVVKWELSSEAFAAEARELLEDWNHGVIRVGTSDQLPLEVTSALPSVCRKHPPRLTRQQSLQALGWITLLPFRYRPTRRRRLLRRAFVIAHRFNQRVYDCVYVALAEEEGLEFWTGDQRLFNALSSSCPLIRWIGGYVRRRP